MVLHSRLVGGISELVDNPVSDILHTRLGCGGGVLHAAASCQRGGVVHECMPAGEIDAVCSG